MLEVDVRVLKPDSFSAISFGAVTAERSFRKSFRKHPASAKPSASFRAHSAKHVSETIRGIVSNFTSSRDIRLKKRGSDSGALLSSSRRVPIVIRTQHHSATVSR